jgi:hypothetical protein
MASITGGSLEEQIQKAISAHGVYKFKLAHMVEAETGDIKPPTAAADNLCPVGQWLYEGLPPSERTGERYRTVVDLHARFHRSAGEVAALSLSRRRTEALEAMELTSSFKRISDQLVAAMEAWAAEMAEPGSSAGELIGGRSVEPEAAAPVVTQPEVTQPEVVEFEAAAPEKAESEVLEFEAIEPEGAEPEEDEAGGERLGRPEDEAPIDDWFGLPRSRPQDGGS